jgi:TRAP-type mannitol/chloroaromatic compound transport system substrate-binding protein
MLHFWFNAQKWGELPKNYKAIAQSAAALERRHLVEAELLVVVGADPLGGVEGLRFQCGVEVPFYYYPGFWEGGAMLHFWFNAQKWGELPKNYKASS